MAKAERVDWFKRDKEQKKHKTRKPEKRNNKDTNSRHAAAAEPPTSQNKNASRNRRNEMSQLLPQETKDSLLPPAEVYVHLEEEQACKQPR